MSSSPILVLGGGCFWCTEAVFVKVRGVTDVESGYAQGHVASPSYEQVCTGATGHNEVIRLSYDPARVSVEQLLEIFFLIHDPTTPNRQGNDVGTQYRSGIYYTTEDQRAAAQRMLDAFHRDSPWSRPVVTELQPLAAYWPAEDYHQDFFERNPYQGYCMAVAAPKVAKFRKTFADLYQG